MGWLAQADHSTGDIMKRAANSKSAQAAKSRKSLNEYGGYAVQEGDAILSVSDIAAFRLQFIDARRPVKLTCRKPVDTAKFRLGSIVDTLQYGPELQVERKVKFGFGLGKTREHLTLAAIVDKFQHADDSYYLTTQYEDDEENDENESSAEDDEIAQNVVFTESEDSGVESGDDLEIGDETKGDNLIPGDTEAFSDDESFDFSNLKDDFDAEDDDDAQTFPTGDADLAPEDIAFRVKSLYQPPLTNLVNDSTFPVTPEPFENLVTQQINLWMGSAAKTTGKPDLTNPSVEALGRYVPNGNSSGLHHDHADNLYLLVQGKKRFTLYLPQDASTLYTVGNIDRVYRNGLIDYQVDACARMWRPMRSDGAIKAEWAKWALENGDTSTYSEEQLEDMIEKEPNYSGEYDASLDPPSFSRVPPVFSHLDELKDPQEAQKLRDLADQEFPGFTQLRKLEVWLEPGEMLYIPTGWFHEVTSYSSDTEPAHIALNWWFMPPSQSVENPYEDEYWADDFETTQMAIQLSKDSADSDLE